MICNTLTNDGMVGPVLPNRITYSNVSQYDLRKYSSATYGVKYVVSGTEYYCANGKEFAVSQKKFLLLNYDSELDLSVRSKKNVIGFCIHIDRKMLHDVHLMLSQSKSWLLDNPFESSTALQFDELLYLENENDLGRYLQLLAQKFDPNTHTISIEKEEVFFHIGKHLLELQNHLPKRNALNVSKHSTHRELIHRLSIAKEILDTTPESCNIEELAKTSMLSPAHFYRSFKKLYQVSPYQYLLKKRLQQAAEMLRKKDQNITEVAFHSGFADLPSFSKSFKKVYGHSPTLFAHQSA